MYFSIVWSVTCHHFTTTLALLFFHSKYTIGLIPIFWPVKENFWKDKRTCFSLHFRCRLSHTQLLDCFWLKVESLGVALISTLIWSWTFSLKPPIEMSWKVDANCARSWPSTTSCNDLMRRDFIRWRRMLLLQDIWSVFEQCEVWWWSLQRSYCWEMLEKHDEEQFENSPIVPDRSRF